MRQVLCFFLGCCAALLSAQNDSAKAPAAADTGFVCYYPEYAQTLPQFPGGDAAFQKYIAENIHYPDSAQDGTAYVKFRVNTDGSISHVVCVKGDPFFCAEAVRVIATMPKWSPGMMDDKVVAMQLVIPIKVLPRGG